LRIPVFFEMVVIELKHMVNVFIEGVNRSVYPFIKIYPKYEMKTLKSE